MKYRIVDIHPDDAYYRWRNEFIGLEGEWLPDYDAGLFNREDAYESGTFFAYPLDVQPMRFFHKVWAIPAPDALNRYVMVASEEGHLWHGAGFEAANIQEAINRVSCYPFDDADGVWPFQEACKYYLADHEEERFIDTDFCLLEFREDNTVRSYPDRKDVTP